MNYSNLRFFEDVCVTKICNSISLRSYRDVAGRLGVMIAYELAIEKVNKSLLVMFQKADELCKTLGDGKALLKYPTKLRR